MSLISEVIIGQKGYKWCNIGNHYVPLVEFPLSKSGNHINKCKECKNELAREKKKG